MNVIPHLHPVHNLRLAFNNVAGRRGWQVGQPPRLGHDGAHHFPGIVDPNNAQVKKDKQHVDGGIYPVVAGFHQHQAILRPQRAPEGEAAQLAAKAIAPFGLRNENFATLDVNNLSCAHRLEV